MILLSLADNHDLRPLPFYLAMEQWIAQKIPGEEALFTWVVRPTVIIGRHQCLETEVDVEYCRSHDIDIVRRLSGGGCVYADPDNLMISYVCPTHRPVTEVFAIFARNVADTLRDLGLNAEVSGRNDILIDGKKVSGCAYYHTVDHAIVHSTMLFGCNPAAMSLAITPERSKLALRGVKSVASRITTISEHNPDITIRRFRSEIRRLTSGEHIITAAEEAEIRQIEARYHTTEHLQGRRLAGPALHKSQRIDGVGRVDVNLSVKNGIITQAAIRGDFLTGQTDVSVLENVLLGQRPGRICLDNIDVPGIITGLSATRLTEIINQ